MGADNRRAAPNVIISFINGVPLSIHTSVYPARGRLHNLKLRRNPNDAHTYFQIGVFGMDLSKFGPTPGYYSKRLERFE